jgi:hypothetical protein
MQVRAEKRGNDIHSLTSVSNGEQRQDKKAGQAA